MKKLVLGMAFATLGTFAMAQQTPQLQEKKVNMEQKHQQKMAEMQKELNLTDAQMAQMKALHEKKIAAIADEITKRRVDVKLILIAGPSSSGKTRFDQRDPRRN